MNDQYTLLGQKVRAFLIHSLIAVAVARGPELHAELLGQLDAWRRA